LRQKAKKAGEENSLSLLIIANKPKNAIIRTKMLFQRKTQIYQKLGNMYYCL